MDIRDSGREAKSTIKLVREIQPPGPKLAPDGVERSIGWKTIFVFALVFLVGVAVFALLPGWLENRSSSTGLASEVPAIEPESAESAESGRLEAAPRNLEELALEKTKAEEIHSRAAAMRDELESKNASSWGGDKYARALTLLASAETKMSSREYQDAVADLEGTIEAMEVVDSRGRALFTEALESGSRALAAGRSAEAREKYQDALEIAPGDTAAAAGLERATNLDQVLALVAKGEDRERKGDLEGASAAYREAVSLDPLWQQGQRALARVDAQAAERAFQTEMSEALRALAAEDFELARAAFERARAIRPDAPEIERGLKQVEEGKKVKAVALHRGRAEELERQETWRDALTEYEAALAIDPTLRFAQEGKARAASRALLAERLDYQLSHPERLSDPRAFEEASRLLDEARGIEHAGSKHQERVRKLDSLLASSSTPIEVQLLSDGFTEVTLYRVGPLGKFDRRVIELRPGNYVVTGSRVGFRDVRVSFSVVTGKSLAPVVVRCEEKI